MGQQAKCRPKTPLVMVDAYFLNQKEEEDLCERLDGMHYHHYATMSTLREETSQAEAQCRNLLAQRTVTQRSSLDYVMAEICSLKDARLSKVRPKHAGLLKPDVITRVGSASPRMCHARGLHGSSSWDLDSDQMDNGFHSKHRKTFLRRAVSADEKSAFTLGPTTVHNQETSEYLLPRKPRAMSSVLRKSGISTETLTYKKLEGIAKIENISLKEAERKTQEKIMAKEKINQLLDDALQQKINDFLKKFEDKRLRFISQSP